MAWSNLGSIFDIDPQTKKFFEDQQRARAKWLETASYKEARSKPLPLDEMTREEKVEELYEVLTRLWSSSGEYHYTVAIERARLKPLLMDLFATTPHKEGEQQ